MGCQRNEKLRQEIVFIRETRPCATLEQIAHDVARTRQRVHKILKGEGKPTCHVKPVKPKHTCLACGTLFQHDGYFCSPLCRQSYYRIPIVCDNCGVLCYILLSYLLYHVTRGQESFCCSTPCRREYWKKHYASRMRSCRKGAGGPEVAPAIPGSH